MKKIKVSCFRYRHLVNLSVSREFEYLFNPIIIHCKFKSECYFRVKLNSSSFVKVMYNYMLQQFSYCVYINFVEIYEQGISSSLKDIFLHLCDLTYY